MIIDFIFRFEISNSCARTTRCSTRRISFVPTGSKSTVCRRRSTTTRTCSCSSRRMRWPTTRPTTPRKCPPSCSCGNSRNSCCSSRSWRTSSRSRWWSSSRSSSSTNCASRSTSETSSKSSPSSRGIRRISSIQTVTTRSCGSLVQWQRCRSMTNQKIKKFKNLKI